MSHNGAAMKAFSAHMPVFMAESIAVSGKGMRNEEEESVESYLLSTLAASFAK
jgi:hypothetical protein